MTPTRVMMATGSGSRLTRIERLALDVGQLVNEQPTARALKRLFHAQVGQRWVHALTRNLLVTDGLEKLASLNPRGGVLLCANHRSFFDQYVISHLLLRNTPWTRELYFPVRSEFFYETISGLAVNLVVGGGAMYPPIFRDPAKADHTRAALDKVVALLQQPGVVVGLHPEGTRGKGPDPYQLLPAQPGVGQVALRARPTILPVWINGLTNDIVKQVSLNFRREVPAEDRIYVVFGDPVELGSLLDEKPRTALYKKAADHILAKVRELGERERLLRSGA